MTRLGRYDTDTQALKVRVDAHEQFGSSDLNAWIVKHLGLEPGQRILEIGCGTGKQTLELVRRVGSAGRVLAFDVSKDAIDAVREKLFEIAASDASDIVLANMDDLSEVVGGRQFDRAVASYSLYYTKQPVRLFETIRRHLLPGGLFFFCGPSHENNMELKRFLDRLTDETKPLKTQASSFMTDIGPSVARDLFEHVEIHHFENPLRFDSAAALIEYWKAHNIFDERLDQPFQAEANAYFREHQTFVTVKRALGVRALV